MEGGRRVVSFFFFKLVENVNLFNKKIIEKTKKYEIDDNLIN